MKCSHGSPASSSVLYATQQDTSNDPGRVAMDVPSQATSHESQATVVPEVGSRRLEFVRLPDELHVKICQHYFW